ncbi:MAG: DUF2892 domain-containing protein [Desulfobacteraceae bacterium]|nr:MAG: DUF2892 domain-containing protein [Desulfobacteraceae bacterium]
MESVLRDGHHYFHKGSMIERRATRVKNLSRNLRIALGILSLVVGIAGLILPILQGWLFLGIGLVLLSRDVPFIKRASDKLEQRFPQLARARKRIKKRFTRGKTS